MMQQMKKRHKQVIYPMEPSRVKIRLVSPGRQSKMINTATINTTSINAATVNATTTNTDSIKNNHVLHLSHHKKKHNEYQPIQLGPHRSKSPQNMDITNRNHEYKNSPRNQTMPSTPMASLHQSPHTSVHHQSIPAKILFNNVRYSMNMSPLTSARGSPIKSPMIRNKPMTQQSMMVNSREYLQQKQNKSIQNQSHINAHQINAPQINAPQINAHQVNFSSNQHQPKVKSVNFVNTAHSTAVNSHLSIKGLSKKSIWETDLRIEEESNSNAMGSAKDSARIHQQLQQIRHMQEEILHNNAQIQLLISRSSARYQQPPVNVSFMRPSQTIGRSQQIIGRSQQTISQKHMLASKQIISKQVSPQKKRESRESLPVKRQSLRIESFRLEQLKNEALEIEVQENMMIDSPNTHKSIINQLNIRTGRVFQDEEDGFHQDGFHEDGFHQDAIPQQSIDHKCQMAVEQSRDKHVEFSLPHLIDQTTSNNNTTDNNKSNQQLHTPKHIIHPIKADTPHKECNASPQNEMSDVQVMPQANPQSEITPSTMHANANYHDEVERIEECNSIIYMSKHQKKQTPIKDQQQYNKNEEQSNNNATYTGGECEIDERAINDSVKLSIKKHTTIKITQTYPTYSNHTKTSQKLQEEQDAHQVQNTLKNQTSMNLHNRSYSGECGVDHTDLSASLNREAIAKEKEEVILVNAVETCVHQLQASKGTSRVEEKLNNSSHHSNAGHHSNAANSSHLSNAGNSSSFSRYSWTHKGMSKKMCNKIYL